MGRDTAVDTAMIVSIIHITQAKVNAHSPQTGTHIAVQSWINVAKPIGNVPRNSELLGS